MNAHAAKMEAKQSAVMFPSLTFEFVTPQSTRVASFDAGMAHRAPFQPSIEEVNRAKKDASFAKGTAGKKQIRNSRPLATRNISLDNIAESMEGARRSPFATGSKENIPVESSSPILGSRPLEHKTTPIKQRANSFKTPPTAALWTRMISSPPTPLSPVNRRRSAHVTGGGGKCANLSQALELACAKARASDRPCGEGIAGGRPKLQTMLAIPRPRTASVYKRLRDEFEIENDAPRKRATVAEGDQMGRPEPWSRTNEEDCRTWRVASWRAICATSINSGDTSASEELITPDNSMIPSSPSSIDVENMSAELVTSPEKQDNVTKPDNNVSGLAALEANAALVLASLFTKV